MSYDAIVVGGGLGGSAFAAEAARAGHRVLVLEREKRFRDRVRGENMLPWGVAAARRLGLVEALVSAGAHQPGFWTIYMLGNPLNHRDLKATTPHGEVSLNIYHPQMQEALLERARGLGAEVKRGANVVGVEAAPDRSPSVTFEYEGQRQTLSARLVVGADGRNSQVRTWAGFHLQRDPELLTIAGILMEDMVAPDGAVHLAFAQGCAMLMAPLGARRARTYFVYPGVVGCRSLSGDSKIPEFIKSCISTGVPSSWFATAKPAGPLAEFQGFDRWVESPAKNGVALIGDAAASTDPSWGCGLSLTVLDVEHLADALKASPDWNQGLARYAREHDEYYGALHRILAWMTELIWTPGPEADERRKRVFPRMMSDPRECPDSIGMGPFGPSDDRARRLTLGLD